VLKSAVFRGQHIVPQRQAQQVIFTALSGNGCERSFGFLLFSFDPRSGHWKARSIAYNP
jgi:hypothetical protein